MADKDHIEYVQCSDGGDGSTYVVIKFKDGTREVVNPDIPYSGDIRIFFDGREDLEREEGDPEFPD